MIFDQNTENLQSDPTSEEPQEESKLFAGDSPADSHGQEITPPSTFPAAALSALVQPVEQIMPQPVPSAVMDDAPVETAPAVSPATTVEQAMSLDTSAESHGQELTPASTLTAAAQSALVQSVEQAIPQFVPSAVMDDAQAEAAPAVSPATTVEQAMSLDTSAESHGQELTPASTLTAAAQSALVQPVEQAIPQFVPSAVMDDAQAEAAPAVSPATTVEQAMSLPADAASSKSKIEVFLSGKRSKTDPNASAVKKTNKKIIAVGGGKGGVGKSMFSANLAVGLSLLGQKVVLADLDLGGADVHLYTGVKSLAKTWNDFLDKKVDSIKDILTPTAFRGLTLIGGDSSRLGSANLPYSQKLKIMRHLKELETDFLIVDLGGDTTYNGLDFFLLADQKIVVSGTEPASVLDSYAFIKVVFSRFLERFFSEHKSLKDLAEQIQDGSFEKTENYSLDFIYQEVRARNPKASVELQEQFNQFRLSIVLNMTEGSKDVRIAESMQKLVKNKCFLDIGILGTIPFDNSVRKAARGFTPIVVENPKCQASRNIHQMLATLILQREREATPADLLQTTSRIRREAKEQIDSGKMTLDGLTVEQINAVFNNTPRLRQSFQRILNIISG